MPEKLPSGEQVLWVLWQPVACLIHGQAQTHNADGHPGSAGSNRDTSGARDIDSEAGFDTTLPREDYPSRC